MAGKLARWLVEDGAAVAKGEAYAEVEVMKMFLSLRAPEAGKVHIQLSEGTVLEAGDLLATMELDDPSMVQKVRVLFLDFLRVLRRPPPCLFVTHLIPRLRFRFIPLRRRRSSSHRRGASATCTPR